MRLRPLTIAFGDDEWITDWTALLTRRRRQCSDSVTARQESTRKWQQVICLVTTSQAHHLTTQLTVTKRVGEEGNRGKNRQFVCMSLMAGLWWWLTTKRRRRVQRTMTTMPVTLWRQTVCVPLMFIDTLFPLLKRVQRLKKCATQRSIVHFHNDHHYHRLIGTCDHHYHHLLAMHIVLWHCRHH